MIFEKGRHTYYDFYIYDTKIEIVEFFKYLGVFFFKNGNWSRTQKRIAQNASFSLQNIFIVFNQLQLPVSQKLDLFDSLVLPTLNYAAAVWGNHPSPDVETIFSKFCRRILSGKPSTNLNAIYSEFGRVPMKIHRKLIMIKYWIKILSSGEDSILFKTYYMLKTDAENGYIYNRNNWAYNIKTILDQIGMSNIWENQLNIIIDYNRIKQRILDIYQQTWYSSINNSPRLRFYSLFKHSFIFESYQDIIKDKKFRTSLTQFRVSSHDLEIEKGRQRNIDIRERVCKNCNSKNIENEYHFLLTCTKYSELRTKLIKRYYYTWPTIQKFTNLLSVKSPKILYNLSKFIYHANMLRN